MSPLLKEEVVEMMAEAVNDMALALVEQGDVDEDTEYGELLAEAGEYIAQFGRQMAAGVGSW